MNSKCSERIQSLIDDLQLIGHPYQEDKIDALEHRSKLFVRRVFNEDSHYLADLDSAFHPRTLIALSSDSTENERRRITRAKNKLDSVLNIFNTMLEDCEMFLAEEVDSSSNAEKHETFSNRVFVVHGHDEETKQATARTLETLGLKPIILHEQANEGRTIIEKFEKYSDVGFAVVLLTPDDLAYPATSTPDQAKYRARQNVILELGYFMGKLDRGRVTVLYRKHADFEMPSDYSGVLYTSYDGPNGSWRFELAKELKAAGYDVDLNKLA
jgi:predicted nucleotide-binding protein